MEIDSKFNSIGPAQGPDGVGAPEGPRVEEGPSRPFGVPAEADPAAVETPPADPLQAKLSGIVRAANLQDPQAATSTERQVLQEILQSIFDGSFLQGLDMNDVLSTFQDFIHNDPALKEILDRFMQDLAGPPRA
jgi:hypothetical protein